MFAKRCPRADELNAFVKDGRGAKKVKRHIETCDVCSGIVADLMRQAELIDTVRQAVEVIDDETRARAAAIFNGLARVQPLNDRKHE